MEIVLALFIVVTAVALFVSERYPSALVAMMVLTVLMLVALLQPWLPWIRPGRWISLEEGVSGFSNPATIVVAAMFVLSAGLQATGAIAWLGPWLGRTARYPLLLVFGLMLIVSMVSAFINNTAAIAIFLPIALTACARSGVAPSRVLIPLSYASQFGGVCTLIGTSTNLLVSSISERSGHGAFHLEAGERARISLCRRYSRRPGDATGRGGGRTTLVADRSDHAGGRFSPAVSLHGAGRAER